MVVFTCQHCNAALKKAVVEKHCNTVCRRNPYLTCVDCLEDFRGDEYTTHTSCVSEDQRYGDKNFVPKPVAVKQNNWMEVVQACIKRNENPKYKFIFQRLGTSSNVPRKKPKFINFLKNGLNFRDEGLAGEIFDLFQYEFMKNNKKETKPESEEKDSSAIVNESLNNSDVTESQVTKKKKDKKRNHLSESSDIINKDEINLNGVSDSVNQGKKKKSKKDKVMQQEKSENIPEEAGLNALDSKAEKDKKKKKKSNVDKENFKENQIEQETDVSNVEEQDKTISTTDQQEKLSKKELKKLKKKQKYEAELKEIEESTNVEEDSQNKQSETQEEAPEKGKSKKHKKRKATLSESEQDGVKKQKVENKIPEENGVEHDSEITAEEPNIKAKFSWEEVIKEILQKSSENELSLKRLSKKVLAEYQAIKGDRETFEQLMSKFNKKINKIPGVRILKDKAKLLVEE